MRGASEIRENVRKAYSKAAQRPHDKHPFPVGCQFALALSYPEELLASLPAECVEAFSGVSNVSILAKIPVGSVVLDLGCGAGLDSLVAARRAGMKGKVLGVDFSEGMLRRARKAAAQAGADNVEFCLAGAQSLPLGSASIDVAVINGIFNLNPARATIFKELARVMRPGGETYAAELVLKEPLSRAEQESESNWFA
jgi:arsenite methyltransferase